MAAEARPYSSMQLSPDGQQVVMEVQNPGNVDIWIYDLARNTPTRLTFDPAVDRLPAWTPDGERVVFTSGRDGGPMNLYWKAADGTGQAERLTTTANIQSPQSFTPDGQTLVFTEFAPGTALDLGILAMDGDRQTEALLQAEAREGYGAVSPDGRWLAYLSDESGQDEVYVRPFLNVDQGRWEISRGFGVSPRWGPNSRELFYQTRGAGAASVSVMAVANDSEPTFRPGTPVTVFDGPYRLGIRDASPAFDVSPDGQRFLMIKEESSASNSPNIIIVVQHWVEELTRLVPIP